MLMNRSWFAFSWLVVLVAALGCSEASSTAHHDHAAQAHKFSGQYPMKVVATTGPVAEMVHRVGGDHVEVEGLMGPGVDPHLYSPVASDVRKLTNADAIFYNGLHLEGRMAQLFEKMADSKATFAVTEGLQSRHDQRLREPPEFAGLYDPHVWHDPMLWADCASDVAQNLSEFDPAHAADYQKNAAAYQAELKAVDKFCQDEIAKIPADRRVLVTAHDAFGYFGKRFGVEVFGLKGISTEEEKDLEHQEEIQRMLIERQIPAVFVESAVAPRMVASLVEPCRAAGLDLQIGGELYADALGAPDSDAADYGGMIRHNAKTIADALSRVNAGE
ncbi:metal ABC transporter solute-binding protein, Zn/Mn family [Lacipirellula limnantheis]|uniref:Periplasmic zinc-binding protein TroA n=1 Tax=Lacipirellula limnantheis TaxID=2528024 RepID=A0A517TZK1_9BACT|nr:zinc ABC transporter substrate-binding protein [Lacipirellula limnantheis]QDT73785.1 Periplasmic zinc-binding protein TroA precursor [Lacipirellula limnantheis]